MPFSFEIDRDRQMFDVGLQCNKKPDQGTKNTMTELAGEELL